MKTIGFVTAVVVFVGGVVYQVAKRYADGRLQSKSAKLSMGGSRRNNSSISGSEQRAMSSTSELTKSGDQQIDQWIHELNIIYEKHTHPVCTLEDRQEDEKILEAAKAGLANKGIKVIPLLIGTFDDQGRVAYEAQEVFVKIGRPAVPYLIEALKQKNYRYHAAMTLGEMGPTAKEAIPVLVNELEDRDMKALVAEALGKIGFDAQNGKGTILLLTAQINQEVHNPGWYGNPRDTGANIEAIKALGRMGSTAKPAIPEMIKALRDPDEWVRIAAGESIVKIDPKSVNVLQALIKKLSDRKQDIRWQTARAIGDIGPDAKAAVPELVQLLDDRYPNVREEAVDSIIQIGFLDKNSIRGLINLMKYDSWQIKEKVLPLLNSKREDSVPVLIQFLDSKDEKVQQFVVDVLKQIGTTQALRALKDHGKL